MNTRHFSDDLLASLAGYDLFGSVSLRTEGPIAKGRVMAGHCFVEFYCNEATSTMAFALIEDRQRIWGLDHDRMRGWHLHPFGDATAHLPIPPQTIPEIVSALAEVVRSLPPA